MYNPENFSSQSELQREVSMLERKLAEDNTDIDNVEEVLKTAVLLFAEGRPPHEVEEVVKALYQKNDAAGNQADARAA